MAADVVGEDLDLLFDILDTDFKGHLTLKEIQLFEESTFFEALDLDQIIAALNFICGYQDGGKCNKTNFRDLLMELERRRNLENKIKWDFNALDCNCDDRISLQSALFLFKSVHVEKFSINLWNSFLSSRARPEEEVSFHEIKMFLCNIPQDISFSHETFDQYNNQVKENQIERDYNYHQSLIAWQEDDTAIAVKEREKQFRSTQLKQSADHLIQRLEDIGMQALLEEDDGSLQRAAERPYERINATDLLNALKDKYDLIRDHLLMEMLKIQVGEGMLTAWSQKERNERLFQVKIKEENLRKEGKIEEMRIQLPGTKSQFEYTLMWLMGESLSELLVKEQNIKNKIIESGMERDEILEEFEKKIAFEEKQRTTTDEILMKLNARLTSEKDMISNRLQGIENYTTMNVAEREHLFCLLFMMQLRALNEKSFENAALSVGLTERLSSSHYEINTKDRQRHEQLARKRLKSRNTFVEKELFHPIIEKRKQTQGRIDKQMEIVQNVEKRLLYEREAFINFLLGKDSTHYRIKAKKLNSDERSNQMLVLKTQWQGWQHRNKDEKIQSIEQHRLILQEAISIVYENKKDEMRLLSPNSVDDLTVPCSLLSALQLSQEKDAKNIINFADKQNIDLDRICSKEVKSFEEEWFENIAVVIFDIQDISDEEEELIKALNDKYDAVRDKLLLEALKKQMSDAEWAKLSEQERQAKLMKLKLMERRLRRDGKFDEAAAILGDAFKNAEHLQHLLGENRQKYLEKMQERLKARKKRVLEGNGEDDDEDDGDIIDEEEMNSTGNILKDLQLRYEQEKDALLRRLQEGEGRYLNEKERQAELMRLRIEKRKAEREGNFEGAALVLGIAERNNAAREEGLRKDRERQEKLARERLEARRNAKRKREKELEDPEPSKDDDISVWQDSVMKELEKKQIKERDFLAEILSDSDINDLCDEARNMSEDERSERIAKLKDKRDELDFEDSSDQEEHGAILEMASAVKMIIRESNMAKSSETEISQNDVTVSLMADLQQIQDKETANIMQLVQTKTQEELADMRTKQMNSRKYEELSNVAEVIFAYEGKSSNNEIMKALDKKYDALIDKLILEGLQKQLGDAEWQAMSEKERQAELIKRRLEQKRLLRDGKLEEAAKLLGEGFAVDASLRKLMGENRARYEEMVKEKLARRREKQRLGIDTNDDEDDDDLEMEDSDSEMKIDAKTLLQDMQNRYEDEKEQLMMKLKGVDAKFYNEKQRQAELARLRREERKVKLEEKFGTAAMVLGLAERNQAALENKLKSDRARQEKLAKERLEKMKEKRRLKQKEMKIVTEGDLSSLKENAMQCIEYRHTLERQALVELFREEKKDEMERANCMTFGSREERLQELKHTLMEQIQSIDDGKWTQIVNEMSAMKELNRLNKLEKDDEKGDISRNDVIVSLIADLQEEQDSESEKQMQRMLGMEREDIIELQTNEVEDQKKARWKNIIIIISAAEKQNNANEEVLVDALQSKYEVLKDKLIMEALENKLGTEEWSSLSENEKYSKMMKIKMKIKQLLDEGKTDELNKMMAELFPDELNLQAMLSLNPEAEKERMEAKERLRKERREAGMSEEEINELERKEDQEFEEELRKKSPKNALLQLEHNFEAEKDALLAAMRGANAKFASERERQAELARIKREQRKARKEDHFESAALVLSLAKTQKEALESKLKSDRERQEKLAKERLLARKNRRLQSNKMEVDEKIEDSDDIITLQERVLSEMERKHTEERDFLLRIIQDSNDSSWNSTAKTLDIVSKQQRLNELKMLRMQWRDLSQSEMLETMNQQIEIFEEATCLKIQMIIDEISSSGNEDDQQLLEKASIRILADLQENQDKEAEHLMKDLSQKALLTLKQLCKVQRLSRDQKWYDNIASCLLGIKNIHGASEKVSENEIVDALDSKYAELKEKLFVDILKKKYGESEWENMSKEEQQKLLQQLRKEEKQIRNGEEVADRKLEEHSLTIRNLKLFCDALSTQGSCSKFSSLDPVITSLAYDLIARLREKYCHVIENEYEAEKDAILASLKSADSKMRGEKERQETLFKLRREQRKLKREDKFDSAAIIFNMAQENKKQQDISFEAERKRQKELAMKRLAARKKKPVKSESTYEKILKEQQIDIQNDVKYADEIEREGIIAAQNVILEEMEKKHSTERETLVELISLAESDDDGKAAANYLTKSQKDEKITSLRNERNSWKQSSLQAAANQIIDSDMTEGEMVTNAKRIAESWEEHQRILVKALVIKMEEMKQTLMADGYDDQKLSEEVSVMLLADLQEKQTAENHALSTVIEDKSQDFLLKVKDDQRKQRREKWMENISNLILGVSVPVRKQSSSKAPDMSDISEEMEGVEEMLEEQEKEQFQSLEEEIENEKQKRKLNDLSEDEMMKVMSELQRQQEAKKQAILSSIEKQRADARRRLEEKRRKRDEKQYEEDMALSIISAANASSNLMREKTSLQKKTQQDSLEDRLRRRREERKLKAEKEAQRIKEEEEEEERKKKEETQKANKPLPLPGGGLRREKTVVEEAAEMDDSQKQEIVGVLMREQTNMALRLNREQTRQELKVKDLRLKRNLIREQREHEAAKIIGLGERQKTIVASQAKSERERQIQAVKERVTRLKYEKTLTMKEPKDPEASGFDTFLNDKETEGLTEDEKMAEVARKMEMKLRQEGLQKEDIGPSPEISETEADDNETATHGVKLDEKMQVQKLKDRYLQKKKSRKNKNEETLED